VPPAEASLDGDGDGDGDDGDGEAHERPRVSVSASRGRRARRLLHPVDGTYAFHMIAYLAGLPPDRLYDLRHGSPEPTS
jgi:hypothetical protein